MVDQFKLDFVVVGPQKTGTTWIYYYLRDEPGVCFPGQVKETFFFDRRYDKGLDWYIRHFKHCRNSHKKAEVAPTYFDVPEVPGRLHQLNPQTKIVITLRNPYDRSYLLYLHQLRYGFVKGTFRQAIEMDPRILSSSYYATHVQRWWDAFGKEQVLVMMYEQLKNDPANYIRRICNFIGVVYHKKSNLLHQEINPDEMSRSNILARVASKGNYWLRGHQLHTVVNLAKQLGLGKFIYGGKPLPTGATEGDYQLMEVHLEPEIARLELMLKQDLSSWKRKPA